MTGTWPWRWAAGCAAVVLIAVAAVVAVWRPWESSVPTCAAPPVPPRVSAAPPTTGGIVVQEKAMTTIHQGTNIEASMATVVHNSSSQIAWNVSVSFNPTDGAGRSTVSVKNRRFAHIEIPRLTAGESVGVAQVVQTYPATATKLAVRIGDIRWGAPGATSQGAIGASRERTKRSDGHIVGVLYDRTSTFCKPLLTRGMSVLYRDRFGRLLGGAFLVYEPESCLPGTSEGNGDAVVDVPAGVDDARTRVYPYCATDPVRPRPNVAPEPINAG